MGHTGRHGSLAAPLVSQTTKFPPWDLARSQRAYVLLPLPPRKKLLIVYSDHIVRNLTYARIQAVADLTASYPGIKTRSTDAERHALTN
eukprot:2243659-Ditylum_brightwellii.AAC.1